MTPGINNWPHHPSYHNVRCIVQQSTLRTGDQHWTPAEWKRNIKDAVIQTISETRFTSFLELAVANTLILQDMTTMRDIRRKLWSNYQWDRFTWSLPWGRDGWPHPIGSNMNHGKPPPPQWSVETINFPKYGNICPQIIILTLTKFMQEYMSLIFCYNHHT